MLLSPLDAVAFNIGCFITLLVVMLYKSLWLPITLKLYKIIIIFYIWFEMQLYGRIVCKLKPQE